MLTVDGIIMDVSDVQPWNAFAPKVASEPSRSNVTDVRFTQLRNTLLPNWVTLLGMEIEVKPEFWNTLFPI